jgi:hypothetical protein
VAVHLGVVDANQALHRLCLDQNLVLNQEVQDVAIEDAKPFPNSPQGSSGFLSASAINWI